MDIRDFHEIITLDKENLVLASDTSMQFPQKPFGAV